jgi:hypothetical protein
MRGVIYARYSPGPHQTDQSIEGQVADCTSFAAENDISIVEYMQIGTSRGRASTAVTSSSA